MMAYLREEADARAFDGPRRKSRWRKLGFIVLAAWALLRFLKRAETGEEPGLRGVRYDAFAGDSTASDDGALVAFSNRRHGGSQRRGRPPPDEWHGRGREADRPSDIPARGWRDILVRVKNRMAEDNLSIISAGVAFYAFFAIFPALAALVSIYGLITSPEDLQEQFQTIQQLLPPEAAGLITTELERIATARETQLGWGLAGGLLLALWGASKGMTAMFQALNVAYDEEERRGYLALYGTAFALTIGAILLVIVFFGIMVGVPIVLRIVGLVDAATALINYLRWPLLALFTVFALAVLYRYGPSRADAQWSWLTWGAVAATILWMLASILFSYYVANFAGYDAVYGSLGVVVALMMWFFLSAYSILVGAVIDAEMEHQTARDTTTGESRPMGEREAYVADTVGM